jgi:hypothetical protein
LQTTSFATDADATGAYHFAYLPTGTYTLTANANGYQRKQTGVDVFRETTLNVSLLAITYVSLIGTVTNATTGTPIAGTIIYFWGATRATVPSTTTDPNGQFRFDQILIGDSTFWMRAIGFVEQKPTFYIDPGTHPSVALEPLPVTTLSGIVTNATTGSPVAGASVQVLSTSGGVGYPSGQQPTVTTDPNGAYRFSTIFAGNTILSVIASGYAESRSGVSIAADGSSTLNFTLTPLP